MEFNLEDVEPWVLAAIAVVVLFVLLKLLGFAMRVIILVIALALAGGAVLYLSGSA